MGNEVDVVVLGLGPGGEHVAGTLAEAGLSVVGVEAGLVGGECPYWGCVPSKMMIRAGNLLAEGRRIAGMAGQSQVVPDWSPVAARIRDEATDDWNDQVAVDRFVGKGGRFVRGWGTLAGHGRVAVDDQVFQARMGVVLSTGASAAVPPIDGLADTPYWTNRQAVAVERLPQSLLVLGGGAIGLELAQAFARFGVAVTVVEALDRLLALEEPESSQLATAALAAEGIRVVTGRAARRVAHHSGVFTVTLDDGQALTAQKLLVATGRRVDLTRLGVDTVDLDPRARAIDTDERMRAGRRRSGLGGRGLERS